jgi:putative sterol carrier protein
LQTLKGKKHKVNLIISLSCFHRSKECLPYLKKSNHAHILNLSPPLNLNPMWFANHVAYTMAKYGMSMCVLGMAEEFKGDKIGVNALWPRTAIHTAAMDMLAGAESANYSRKPEIMADAAYEILCRDPTTATGNFFIDDEVLKAAGVTDMTQYACVPANVDKLMPDFFLDAALNIDPTQYVSKGSHMDQTVTKSDQKPAAGGNVAALFAKIESLLSPEIVAKVNAVYQFNVKGEEAGTWFCDLKNGTGKVGKGEAEKPDATLTMDSKNFYAMFTGKIKPASAFMTGKLKISGDLQKAMKLEKLMGSLKSKL